MKNFIQILKAIADEKRLRILNLLMRRKMCVCELAEVLKISQPAVSKHLKKLLAVGLIRAEKESFWTDYCVCPVKTETENVLQLLKKSLSENKELLNDLATAKKINRKNICKK